MAVAVEIRPSILRRSPKRSKASLRESGVEHTLKNPTPTRSRVLRERVRQRSRTQTYESETASSLGLAALHPATRRLHHDRGADQCGRFAEVREADQRRQI